VSLVIGPNAVGKSNFLDVIRFLRDPISLGGGLSEASATRAGVSKLRSVHARQNSAVRIIVEADLRAEGLWSYDIAFTK
jgi:predicted ATPase